MEGSGATSGTRMEAVAEVRTDQSQKLELRTKQAEG